MKKESFVVVKIPTTDDIVHASIGFNIHGNDLFFKPNGLDRIQIESVDVQRGSIRDNGNKPTLDQIDQWSKYK